MNVSTIRNIRLSRLLLALVIASASNVATATDGIAVCTSMPVNASLMKNDGGHRLVLTVANPTDDAVNLTAFYFESNLLRLSAVAKENNQSLPPIVPLVSPGVAPIKIRAKEKFVREFDLDSIFPDLESALMRSPVVVSWRLTLDPGTGCFSAVIDTSLTIPKNAAAP
jgi:hypothetical protein